MHANNLTYGQLIIKGASNKKNRSNPLKKEIKNLETSLKANPEQFLNKPQILAYRSWIATTKSAIDTVVKDNTDQASVILIRLIQNKGSLPTISRIVDCMNYISIKYGVAISIWDSDLVSGSLQYSLSKGGEKYWPFMADSEITLLPGELIATDEKGICHSLTRYRDSKYGAVTIDTKNICVHIQGINVDKDSEIEEPLSELEKMLLSEVEGTVTEHKLYKMNF